MFPCRWNKKFSAKTIKKYISGSVIEILVGKL